MAGRRLVVVPEVRSILVPSGEDWGLSRDDAAAAPVLVRLTEATGTGTEQNPQRREKVVKFHVWRACASNRFKKKCALDVGGGGGGGLIAALSGREATDK